MTNHLVGIVSVPYFKRYPHSEEIECNFYAVCYDCPWQDGGFHEMHNAADAARAHRGGIRVQVRVAEANPGQPQKEVVAAIKQKPWIHTGGPE